MQLDTPHSVGLLWMSDQPDAETCTFQHTTLTTVIHPPGGILTHNPSKRVAADQHLLHCGHWDQPKTNTDMRRLMTGICPEKCVIRQFCHCANVCLHIPR